MELAGGLVRAAYQGVVPTGDAANNPLVLEHGGRLGDRSPFAHRARVGVSRLQRVGQGNEPRRGQREHADAPQISRGD